ncbi:MAG: hypothetical protein ABF330_05845 [Lentimonas sp.]
MKNTYIIFPLLVCSMIQVGNATVPQIKFSGKPDWVLSSAERAMVLTVVNEHLNSKDSDFLAQLDDLKSPFPVEIVTVAEPEAEPKSGATTSTTANQATEVEEAAVQVVYDDVSVLRGVGENFVKQVRGTLARGDQNYIQLQGGKLMKTGSSFPVRIPGAQNQTHIVKLIEVTSDDYTLSLGDATLTVSYSEAIKGVKKTP